MSAELPIDPDLRGLLVELAERPDHVALGARVHRFQDLLRPETVTLRPTTGMGMLEAKLLAAHREELAHLLLQASQVQVADAALLQPRDRKGLVRTVEPARWRRSAQTVTHNRLADVEAIGPLQLLRRLLSGEGRVPTPLELAISSLRLVPRTGTTIWVGVHCGLEGDRERGIQLQRSVLTDSAGGYYAAYAWTNIAWLAGELGRFHDSLEAGREAALANGGMPRGLVAWFLAAIQVGSSREALRASRDLTDVLQDRPESLQEHIGLLREKRRRRIWFPTAEAEAVAQQLCGRVSTEAEQFLEIFV